MRIKPHIGFAFDRAQVMVLPTVLFRPMEKSTDGIYIWELSIGWWYWWFDIRVWHVDQNRYSRAS